ncbi:putative nucleotidyltransferase substrate binding domain-containing protein [Pseudodesulfovibrio sp.]|uniref:putative nucleotidyltransferase substrate binding domain-containing protein n=1 Tax=unclassified Pseudodesulfovibrio TaxID=2661612 RepID=UPI003B002F70
MSSQSWDERTPTTAVDGGFAVPDGLDRDLLSMAREGRLTGIRSTRVDLVQDWLDRGLSAEETCCHLSAYNRSVILAVLEAHAEEHSWLRSCAFLEFGSGGRDEQVVGSDQDNGLLLRGVAEPGDLDDVTQSIVVALDGAGIPLCDGGVMISNPQWRGDFDAWLERLTGWLSNPAERGIWQSGLILDFKAVFGASEEAALLREHVWKYVRTKPIALSLLIGELTDYRLPLTFFGAFVTEKDVPWHGFLNLKKSILAHLTNGARILALKYGLSAHGTCDRLRGLMAAGHISDRHGGQLLDGWEYLQRKRLEIGLDCVRAGAPPHGWVKPSALARDERERLKEAIHAVDKFIHLIQSGVGL